MFPLEELDITLVEPSAIWAIAGETINPSNSVITYVDVGSVMHLRYVVHNQGGCISARNRDTIEYIEYVFGTCARATSAEHNGQSFRFIFQGDDRPRDEKSISWQTKVSYQKICLVPDFYYTSNRGYIDFLPDAAPAWDTKKSSFIWRGATTGGWDMTLESFLNLPRLELCQVGRKLGNLADFGFYNIVQARSQVDKQKIEEYLISQELMKNYVELEDFSKFKFFIQMDGNGNSWDLVKKLRLGSCMLLVDSPWLLWHNRMIRAWEHYVPVKNDLSNFGEMAEWCLTHDSEARGIASKGRAFALSLDYEDEMKTAADNISKHAELIT